MVHDSTPIPADQLATFRNWFWDTDREDRRDTYSAMTLNSARFQEVAVLDALAEYSAFYNTRMVDLFEVAETVARFTEGCAGEAEAIGVFVLESNHGTYMRIHTEDMYYEGAWVGAAYDVELLWSHFYYDWSRTLNKLFQPNGEVYLLAGGGYHKIGRAQRVTERVKQLGILLPYPIELVHHFPCANYTQAESTLHEMFASKRAHGEWFSLDEHDVSLIENIVFMRGSAIEWGDIER